MIDGVEKLGVGQQPSGTASGPNLQITVLCRTTVFRRIRLDIEEAKVTAVRLVQSRVQLLKSIHLIVRFRATGVRNGPHDGPSRPNDDGLPFGVVATIERQDQDADHHGVGLSLVVATCLDAQFLFVALHIVGIPATLLRPAGEPI